MSDFTEEWKPVVGYEGIYEVSNLGNVKRVCKGSGAARPGHVMKPRINTTGYPEVALSKNGKKCFIKVHKLVAEAFLGPRPAGFQINHKNAEKTDPRLDNLEYVTRADNYAHAVINSLYNIGEECHSAILTVEKVREIRKLAETTDYVTIARQFGIAYQTAWNVVKKRTWKHVS